MNPALRDAVEKSAAQLSLEHAKATDEILRTAINFVAGTDWNIFEIASRMKRVRVSGSNFERWILDGVPIVQIFDPQTRVVDEDGKKMFKMEFQYRFFPT